MKIKKGIWVEPGTTEERTYLWISAEDYDRAVEDGEVLLDCCPFCKLERGLDVPHEEEGDLASDKCPECYAVEILAHEWCRDLSDYDNFE